ncbi:MAG: hypothetical protein IKW77_02450 [Salinivirgaceae bacterium]|nr:hypothetical protein [Salinivirgaceae bacterium]
MTGFVAVPSTNSDAVPSTNSDAVPSTGSGTASLVVGLASLVAELVETTVVASTCSATFGGR